MNTRPFQLLGCAGGRGETFDLITLRFGRGANDRKRSRLTGPCDTLDSLDTIPRTQNIFNRALLVNIQVLVSVCDGDSTLSRTKWFEVVLALTHPPQDFMLGGNRFGGCEEATSLMRASLEADKFVFLMAQFQVGA